MIVDASHYLWREPTFMEWVRVHGVNLDDLTRIDINEFTQTMTVYEVDRTGGGDLLLDWSTMKAAHKPPREIALKSPVPKGF